MPSKIALVNSRVLIQTFILAESYIMSSPARTDNWQDTFLRRWRIGKWCFNASGANFYILSTISLEQGSEKKLGCIIQG